MSLAGSARAVGARFAGLLPQHGDWVAVRRAPRADLLAGLTVAVVALPFGVTSASTGPRSSPPPTASCCS